MIRNIKALGLAFVAVAAMSVAAAAGAQGAELHAATTTANTDIQGQQTTQHKFQITHPNGPNTQCAQALFETSTPTAKTSKEVTITAQYTTCQAFGQFATINMNGCKYTVTDKGALTAQVDITGCTANKKIEVITNACTITVPEQSTIGGHLTFTAGPPVIATIAVSGIQYQVHGPLCGHTTNVTTSDGTYQGTATFKAFEAGTTKQDTHNGHQFSYRQQPGAERALTAT